MAESARVKERERGRGALIARCGGSPPISNVTIIFGLIVWDCRYEVRKLFAESRLRLKGRFVKKEDEKAHRDILELM
jgi:hypothetical protein